METTVTSGGMMYGSMGVSPLPSPSPRYPSGSISAQNGPHPSTMAGKYLSGMPVSQPYQNSPPSNYDFVGNSAGAAGATAGRYGATSYLPSSNSSITTNFTHPASIRHGPQSLAAAINSYTKDHDRYGVEGMSRNYSSSNPNLPMNISLDPRANAQARDLLTNSDYYRGGRLDFPFERSEVMATKAEKTAAFYGANNSSHTSSGNLLGSFDIPTSQLSGTSRVIGPPPPALTSMPEDVGFPKPPPGFSNLRPASGNPAPPGLSINPSTSSSSYYQEGKTTSSGYSQF